MAFRVSLLDVAPNRVVAEVDAIPELQLTWDARTPDGDLVRRVKERIRIEISDTMSIDPDSFDIVLAKGRLPAQEADDDA